MGRAMVTFGPVFSAKIQSATPPTLNTTKKLPGRAVSVPWSVDTVVDNRFEHVRNILTGYGLWLSQQQQQQRCRDGGERHPGKGALRSLLALRRAWANRKAVIHGYRAAM